MACRTARPKRELVRIVRLPNGALELDATGRVAGRGAYLCADGACWQAALDKGALPRAFGVPVPAELRERLAAGPGEMTTNAMTTNMTTTGGEQRGEE